MKCCGGGLGLCICICICECEPHHMCVYNTEVKAEVEGLFSQGKGSEEVVWTRSSGFPAIDSIHRKKDKIVVSSCRGFIVNISLLFSFYFQL